MLLEGWNKREIYHGPKNGGANVVQWLNNVVGGGGTKISGVVGGGGTKISDVVGGGETKISDQVALTRCIPRRRLVATTNRTSEKNHDLSSLKIVQVAIDTSTSTTKDVRKAKNAIVYIRYTDSCEARVGMDVDRSCSLAIPFEHEQLLKIEPFCEGGSDNTNYESALKGVNGLRINNSGGDETAPPPQSNGDDVIITTTRVDSKTKLSD
ncbi:unnamed protein product [Microthlaspi erraticum]|uniref:Uncharacterized protein n=1 Tax=Microthlaspi erraticum TaxID=1685480 RepID=A0A6D2JT19_9BRAS|nr:unnamed protein product [Microthlaspi erraticum]